MKRVICLMYLLLNIISPFKAETIQPIDTIPFEIGADNRIYVTVHINGNENIPLKFLLDTGATDIVINSNSSRTKGIISFNKYVSNNSANSSEIIPATDNSQTIKVGKQVISQLKFISISYPPDIWDGVLGLSFLKNFDVVIDYKQRNIFLYKCGNGNKIASKEYIELDFEYRMGVPVTQIGICINEKTYSVYVEIDSGSDRVFDLNTHFVKNNNLIGTKKPFAISTISGTAINEGKLLNVFFDYIKIGKITLPRIPGAFSTVKNGIQASDTIDGVIGNNLLQRFNQIYDFKNNKIYLEVNDRLYTPFYNFLID